MQASILFSAKITECTPSALTQMPKDSQNRWTFRVSNRVYAHVHVCSCVSVHVYVTDLTPVPKDSQTDDI